MARDFFSEHPLNLALRMGRAGLGRLRGILLRATRFFAPDSGWNLFFGAGARFQNPRAVKLGNGVTFGCNARIECFFGGKYEPGVAKLVIGDDTTFGDGVHIGCINSIVIGRSVLFGSYVLIVDHSHGSPRADLAASEIEPPRVRPIVSKAGVVIEDNAWIGDGVVILPGARIGAGSIIGANAVVRGELPARTIFLGGSM